MQAVNKYHWYDGGFYDRIIATNQKNLFKQIVALMESNKDVVDVGCGTGFFSFYAVNHCNFILGIDLSTKNIAKANSNLIKRPNRKLSFENAYLHDIIARGKNRFDYAVLTYVIHEVDEADRVPLLKEMASVADKIIIGDYRIPRSKGFAGKVVKTVEFLAGSEHYRNFKTYQANGGLAYLAEQAGLTIRQEQIGSANHLVVLSK